MNCVYFWHCTHLKSIGNQFEYCSGAWLIGKAKALDGFATDGQRIRKYRRSCELEKSGACDLEKDRCEHPGLFRCRKRHSDPPKTGHISLPSSPSMWEPQGKQDHISAPLKKSARGHIGFFLNHTTKKNSGRRFFQQVLLLGQAGAQ